MDLAHLLEEKDKRILLRAVVGIPVTLLSVPFILLGLLTVGGLSSTEPFSLPFLTVALIVSLSSFGLLGLVGAWARMFETSSSLAARPRVRKAIAIGIGLGIVASGGIAIVMLVISVKFWLVSLVFGAIAGFGWLLLEAS